MVKALAIALMLSLAGCASQPVEYVTAPLPKPPRPELPTLSGEELECLSDEAYRKVVTRGQLRRDYAEQLEAVILSTHEDGEPSSE